MSAETKGATKVRVLFDAKVEAEFTLAYTDTLKWDAALSGFRERTTEERAVMLAEKCKEFETFVRDHRSQDPVYLSVVREYRDECSACHETWEPLTDETGTHCFNCGAEVDA